MEKQKNKILTSILCSILAFSMVSVSSANASGSLSDIGNSYAKVAIQELVEAGIITGMGNGKFDPVGKITRQDFAIIIAKSLGLDTDTPPSKATFSDLPKTHYSFKYVEAAVKAGLIQGMGQGRFGVDKSLSREQMAVLFVRATGTDASGYGKKLTFTDANRISSWAKDAVGFAVEKGIIKGTNLNTFNPVGNAERQAVALVASDFIKAVKAGTLPSITTKLTAPTTPVPPPIGGGSNSDLTAPGINAVSINGMPVLLESANSGTFSLNGGNLRNGSINVNEDATLTITSVGNVNLANFTNLGLSQTLTAGADTPLSIMDFLGGLESGNDGISSATLSSFASGGILTISGTLVDQYGNTSNVRIHIKLI